MCSNLKVITLNLPTRNPAVGVFQLSTKAGVQVFLDLEWSVLSRNCSSPHAAQGLRPGSGCLDLDAQSRRYSLDSADNY
jgi:hypothetical protein